MLHLAIMPTAHRRIALTRDPELDEALRRAKPLLGENKPTATLARELILRGARELHANEGTELDHWLNGRHATPIERSSGEARRGRLNMLYPAKSGTKHTRLGILAHGGRNAVWGRLPPTRRTVEPNSMSKQ